MKCKLCKQVLEESLCETCRSFLEWRYPNEKPEKIIKKHRELSNEHFSIKKRGRQ